LARPASPKNLDGDGDIEGRCKGMLMAIQFGVDYLKARFGREDGAVSTEYGLLLVLIALAIVAAATALGLAISGVFEDASDSLGPVTS
jgi:Flp pilus assembly pilin Flp